MGSQPMMGGMEMNPVPVSGLQIGMARGPGTDGIVTTPFLGGVNGPTIVVATDQMTMQQELGGNFNQMMPPRMPRRGGGFRQMGGMGFGGMMPNVPRYSPVSMGPDSPIPSSSGTGQVITVKKLE